MIFFRVAKAFNANLFIHINTEKAMRVRLIEPMHFQRASPVFEEGIEDIGTRVEKHATTSANYHFEPMSFRHPSAPAWSVVVHKGMTPNVRQSICPRCDHSQQIREPKF